MPANDPVVVRAKLLVPARRRGHVPRPGLVARLEPRARLTLVSAPTGFGKTSLLAEWAATTPGLRFAWVSLDAGDDEPHRFWRYVAAALEGAGELPGAAGRLLRAPGVSIADEVLPALVNELASADASLVLLLDDMHLIASDAIYRQLRYLVERMPPDVHVVLATQADPPLLLGRLRALGDVIELRGEALRFTGAETDELLNGAHELGLSATDVEALHRRTEGWVAGLNLAALSLRETSDRTAFLDGLPVEERFLVDYLWDEVVLRQPAEVRRFLMRTSILERLSGPLADAVAEREDSREMLLALERSNLFVVPLDPDRHWFRYHHLFRGLLLRQLERVAPELVADLHRRASSWFAVAGDVRGTIEHSLGAGDVQLAAGELERHWLELYSDGHAGTLVRWIDALPEDVLEEHPDLALARFGVSRATGPLDRAEHWIGIAERAAPRLHAPAARDDLLSYAARQRSMNALFSADTAGAVRHGRRAVELATGDGPRLTACFFLGIALLFDGEVAESEALLRTYLAATAAGAQDVRRVFAMGLVAEICAVRGDLGECDALVGAGLAFIAEHRLEEHPPAGRLHVAAGIAALARGASDAAGDRFERAATLARRGGDRVEIAQALLWLGRARLRLGAPDSARDALDRAIDALHGRRVPWLAAPAETLARELADASDGQPADQQSGKATISDAELRVLRLMPSELSYREIAGELYVSLNTVRTHAGRIRRKLGAATRAEAVSRARERELL